MDGNEEDRRGTVSVFNGPDPIVHVFDAGDQEIKGLALWWWDDLRHKEGAKIKCGEKHFAVLAGGDNPAQYIKATSVDDINEPQLMFHERDTVMKSSFAPQKSKS